MLLIILFFLLRVVIFIWPNALLVWNFPDKAGALHSLFLFKQILKYSEARKEIYCDTDSFQLQRRISFPFLCAKYLRTSLLIARTRIFYSPVRRGNIRKVSVHWVQKYFLHDCSTNSIFCSEQGEKESDEKNIKTRQRRDRDEPVLLLEMW